MGDCSKCIYEGNCLVSYIIILGKQRKNEPVPHNPGICCHSYKDRAQFIDITDKDKIVVFPCKIGDIGYFIVGEHILKDVVHSFLVYRDHIMIKTAKGYDLFPEWFHLSQEEAEKELEEKQQDCRTVIKL